MPKKKKQVEEKVEKVEEKSCSPGVAALKASQVK